MDYSDRPIIVKKVKKSVHPHHGGAWKIAYADFVTAMMAFFLLLWLISMTTPEQKLGLASYFAPPSISESNSGAGGLLGGTAPSEDGAKRAGASSDIVGEGSSDGVNSEISGSSENDSKQSLENLKSKEDQAFHSAATSIRQAWDALPEIKEISKNLVVEVTEDGLDIQIVEQRGRRMFPKGSKYPEEVTRAAIAAIAPILDQLPNQLRISGHTAAGEFYPTPQYGAWELSSDRANVTRKILSEFGVHEDHFHSVTGRAAEEPYFPDDPYLAANERVKIVVTHGASPFPLAMKGWQPSRDVLPMTSEHAPAETTAQESSAGHGAPAKAAGGH